LSLARKRQGAARVTVELIDCNLTAAGAVSNGPKQELDLLVGKRNFARLIALGKIGSAAVFDVVPYEELDIAHFTTVLFRAEPAICGSQRLGYLKPNPTIHDVLSSGASDFNRQSMKEKRTAFS
jgi:hypothetical protein